MALGDLWMVALLMLAAGCWFFLESSGSFAETSRAVLHGLCAQQPSHSLSVGGDLLPFDSRMTGIYTGTLMCWGVLLWFGRPLAKALPALPVTAVLVGAVALLAVDGFNSLFVDLGLRHLYEPRNVLRFFTGFGTGVALASLQSWLIGTSLWKLGKDAPMWRSPKELAWAPPAAILVYVGVVFAPGWSYAAIAILLMASAWITVTGLVLVIIVSMSRIEPRVMSRAQLHVPLAVSAAVALGVMLGLAQGRFWLEARFGIPQELVATAPPVFGAILPL